LVHYSVLPFSFLCFPTHFPKGDPNRWRNLSGNVFKVLKPLVITWVTYSW
uniref:Cytochrome b-c1 complex subunit 8 n=1 Tax=Xenopus tropicalis TaxID=8364 RepID=A0A803JTA8_XENTR